jgi:hypothetical protein
VIRTPELYDEDLPGLMPKLRAAAEGKEVS